MQEGCTLMISLASFPSLEVPPRQARVCLVHLCVLREQEPDNLVHVRPGPAEHRSAARSANRLLLGGGGRRERREESRDRPGSLLFKQSLEKVLPLLQGKRPVRGGALLAVLHALEELAEPQTAERRVVVFGRHQKIRNPEPRLEQNCRSEGSQKQKSTSLLLPRNLSTYGRFVIFLRNQPLS